jgi:hypothetical protein
MALANFLPNGAATLAVSSTPLAVQVSGTTCLITNLGLSTVYGTLGGSGASSVPSLGVLSGSGVGSPSFTNITSLNGGIPILPLGAGGASQVILSVSGSNTFLWLMTLPGVPTSVVNVACGA